MLMNLKFNYVTTYMYQFILCNVKKSMFLSNALKTSNHPVFICKFQGEDVPFGAYLYWYLLIYLSLVNRKRKDYVSTELLCKFQTGLEANHNYSIRWFFH